MFREEKDFFDNKILPIMPAWIVTVFVVGMVGAFLPVHSWAEKPIAVIFFVICIIPLGGVVAALIFSVFESLNNK